MSWIPALLLSLAWSPALPGETVEDGAVAPAGRWTVAGGAVSGSGQSSTKPPRGPVTAAWEVDFEGTVATEPLVWDERVLVELAVGGGRRELHTLDLFSGAPAARPHVVGGRTPLVPSLWGNAIAVRRGADTLEVLRWGRAQISHYWTYRAEGAIGPPLLFGTEIYLASEAGLERLRIGRKQPVWRVPGRFRGRPALRGERLFAVQYDVREHAFLTVVDRRTGEIEGQIGLGAHAARPALDPDRLVVAVHAQGAYVWSATPFETPGSGTLECIGIPLPLPRARRFELMPGTGAFRSVPVEAGDGWVADLNDAELGNILAHDLQARGLELQVLAYEEVHPEFARGAAPWSVAGAVAFQGHRAVDLSSGRILWNADGGGALRSVPARETVLVVEPPGRLVALRDRARPQRKPIVLAADGDLGAGARAVLRDGSSEVGELGLRLARGELVRGPAGRAGSRPLDEVLLLEDERGRLAYAADEEAFGRALELLGEREEARAYARLAERARGTNDLELMTRLLGEAVLRGAPDAELARVRRRIEELEEGRPSKKSERLIRSVLEEEAALAGLPQELAWRRFAALPAESPLRARAMLLRAVLAHGPHAGAEEAVSALIPGGLRLAGGSGALDWLDFAQAIDACPIELVERPTGGAAPSSPAERALARAARSWRADLVGFQSEHLLVITPHARPGAIARCLSMGELVCEALAEIFRADGAVKDSERLLVLHLYESKDEYLREGGDGVGEAGVGLEWTAGHYDVQANLSRIYLPEGDEALEEVLRTYAHELTHHWLKVQCPRFDRVRPDADSPGYWIVEGFASLVEDFRFDPVLRTWDPFDPRSMRLDNVANAEASQLLDWPTLFASSQRQFFEAEASGESRIATTWYLGRRNRLTPRHAYYSQAAATCQYLYHAEGGRRREALLDYLERYYTGQREGLDVRACFGLGADELGARVQAYARAVLSGERP